MGVEIFYTDLRCVPSQLLYTRVEWISGKTALSFLQEALGEDSSKEIDNDLRKKSSELIVSWYDKDSKEICEIGGTGSLNWIMPDNYVLSVCYENEFTTEEQIEESIKWTLLQNGK